MKIAIASGKGGVGKTTFAVNLASSYDKEINLVDCDVEEPNCHLFFDEIPYKTKEVFNIIPKLDKNLCDNCGICRKFCNYGAIINGKNHPLIFDEMCHSCGGCIKLCPKSALIEEKRKVGEIEFIKHKNINLISGKTTVGTSASPFLIKHTKNMVDNNNLTIFDIAPGSACPVVSGLFGCDVALLIAEPTPFGLHDLKLIVSLIKDMNIPFFIVVNKMEKGNSIIHDFCKAENIKIIMELEENQEISKIYSNGKILVNENQKYKNLFKNLLDELVKKHD